MQPPLQLQMVLLSLLPLMPRRLGLVILLVYHYLVLWLDEKQEDLTLVETMKLGDLS